MYNYLWLSRRSFVFPAFINFVCFIYQMNPNVKLNSPSISLLHFQLKFRSILAYSKRCVVFFFSFFFPNLDFFHFFIIIFNKFFIKEQWCGWNAGTIKKHCRQHFFFFFLESFKSIHIFKHIYSCDFFSYVGLQSWSTLLQQTLKLKLEVSLTSIQGFISSPSFFPGVFTQV